MIQNHSLLLVWGNELGESEQKYIETWRKFCPDYEIKRWDESTIDLSEIWFLLTRSLQTRKNGPLFLTLFVCMH